MAAWIVRWRRSRRMPVGTCKVRVTAGSIYSSVTFNSMMLMALSRCQAFVIPRQEGVDIGLFVAARDGPERSGQPSMGIDDVELAGLDERRDHRPVLRPGVMAGEERVLSVERNRADGAFDGVAVEFDAAVGQEQGQTVPVFGDVFESLAYRGFGRDAGAVGGKPGLECVEDRL